MKILDASIQNELLIRLKYGDEQAFNAIYKIFSPSLYLRILRMVKDEDVADELLQELFIKLWDNHPKIDPDKSFQSYIYTIAQNLVYNYFRKVSSDNHLIQSLLVRSTEQYLNGQQILENKEISGILKDAIDQLTPQRKLVFNLCKLEGKSYEETSRILGISVATVNSHMTQSLQSIKAYLSKHYHAAFLLMSVYVTSEILKR